MVDRPPEHTTAAMELCTTRLLNATRLEDADDADADADADAAADADADAVAFRGDGWRVIKDMMISIKIKNQPQRYKSMANAARKIANYFLATVVELSTEKTGF